MTNNTSQQTTSSDGSKYIRDQTLEEEAIEYLSEAAAAKGEPLSLQDYRDWESEHDDADVFTANRITNTLGKWEQACQKADIQSAKETLHMGHTIDEYIDSIQAAAAAVGEPLTAAAYETWRDDQDDIHPYVTFYSVTDAVNSWKEACHMADVACGADKAPKYSTDEMIAAIQAAATEFDRLTTEKYNNWRNAQSEDYPHAETIKDSTLGPWTNACTESGVKHGKLGGSTPDYDADDCTTAVRQAATDMGEPLSLGDYNNWRNTQDKDHPSESVIRRILGTSWTQTCENMGVEHANEKTVQP